MDAWISSTNCFALTCLVHSLSMPVLITSWDTGSGMRIQKFVRGFWFLVHPRTLVKSGGTVGATMAVKNAGKAGKIVVFGIDGNEQLANFMLSPDNILQATTAQQPRAIGQKTIEMAIKAIKGEKMDKHLIVPGILLNRANPDGLKSFLKDMEALTK